MEQKPQALPVRVYQSEERIMLAAPMSGLEPGDISVNISGNAVSIRGEERGAGQHERDLIMEEWRIGPYYREVSLPEPVAGPLTNATFGNGVLVLSMPKLRRGQAGISANFSSIRSRPLAANVWVIPDRISIHRLQKSTLKDIIDSAILQSG